ncbi:MAG: class I SAM-dependent RNA methyltransferase [Rhodocyclaceae bacterium]|nr:class I SAM-dependent RNA methyltransferase [Rhodocyclaceae bacterium]
MLVFAPCPRGLEELLVAEFSTLGLTKVAAVGGGVQAEASQVALCMANLHSRYATRLLVKLAEKPYQKEDDIYKMARDIAWHEWFDVSQSIRVNTTAVKSPLKSLDFVTLRVKDGVCDRFRADRGARPNVDTNHPDQRIQLFLTETTATLYIDSSGEPLWQRGYRGAAGQAPLKENLAAGILALAGWNDIGEDGKPVYQTFLDPMCGSGTIVIEAAWMRTHTAPGLSRRFACERWAKADKALWAKLRADARAAIKPLPEDTLFASDAHPGAIAATHRHLEQVGFANAVAIMESNFVELAAPAESGLIVTNPPYGVRLSEQDALRAEYPEWGRTLKQQFAGWTAAFFTGDLELTRGLGLKPRRRFPLKNGALDCRLFVIDLVAGFHRRQKPSEPS